MKVAHWTIQNNSGMHNVATTFVVSEQKLGLDSILADPSKKETWGPVEDADVHVVHTHLPDVMRKMVSKPLKVVWVGHGTPEHCFQTSVEAGSKGGYGVPDSFMLLQYWLQTADARVTFWPRHKAIYHSLSDNGTKIHCLPLGIDKSFWKPIESRGKFLGAPSVFSSENPHYIKWPLDLLIAWPWVRKELPESWLHLTYMVRDQHKWFYPLANRNGASYAGYVSDVVFQGEDLRNAFVSTDYYIGLVRYGDFNRVCLEASACGSKVISYEGNPYADYWVPEGDQRTIASRLIEILSGKVEARKKEEVPDASVTAEGMKAIYEGVLS